MERDWSIPGYVSSIGDRRQPLTVSLDAVAKVIAVLSQSLVQPPWSSSRARVGATAPHPSPCSDDG